ncbi:MAG: hypothetical protein ACLQVX_20435 [Limisphaerales bacterium]
MKPNRFTAERLETFLQHQTVATLPELKTALGTAIDATVFRKLSSLAHRTSWGTAICIAPSSARAQTL